MNKIILKKNEERRVKQGHLWVFSNEIENRDALYENGDLVNIYDWRGGFVASGFYNANSLIAVRVLSREENFSVEELIEKRILAAYEFRKSVYPGRDSFRLIFSESDLLPGLIIDKYNNTFVMQVYSAGIEKNLEIVTGILKNKLHAKNILTKHDEYFRKLENLPEEDMVFLGGYEEEMITDGKIRYRINFEKGQKTGFFFDQCDNREYFGKFCRDKKVLDCFCNAGGFGLHAASNRAASVTFVDSSSNEIENCKHNFKMNELDCPAEYVTSEVFDYLEKCVAEKRKFDIVNIDPPAFAKSRKNLPKAVKAYEKLNKLAISLVKENGFLFSSSCSHHLKREDFTDLIGSAAVKAGRDIQLIYFNGASLDHPSLPAMEETGYLKFAGLRVI